MQKGFYFMVNHLITLCLGYTSSIRHIPICCSSPCPDKFCQDKNGYRNPSSTYIPADCGGNTFHPGIASLQTRERG